MDLEETKKVIQNKITAHEAAREVTSHIKSYIHEKQNLTEGFTETFKPLIETSEAVKTSIDTQQNKLIKQLQDNQLALTEGLDKNRLAITSGFDKMDEVKKWDLQQLPGYEATLDAIEEPEKEDEAEVIKEKIKIIDARINQEIDSSDELVDLANKAKEEGKIELRDYYLGRTKQKVYNIRELEKERKRLQEILDEESEETVGKPKITTVTYGKEQMDKYLSNKETVDLLNFYGLKLPSKYKDKSLEEFQEAVDKGLNASANYKKSIKDVAKYKKDSNTGMVLAFPKAGENAREKTKELIKEHNIFQIFINNMREIRNYKQLTGTGIIHFNNPQQLVDRLELLAGSIFAGNNGVKQEFSQIAHLLHQLKVITKKTLNDLLYIVKINNGKSYSHFFNQQRKNWRKQTR